MQHISQNSYTETGHHASKAPTLSLVVDLKKKNVNGSYNCNCQLKPSSNFIIKLESLKIKAKSLYVSHLATRLSWILTLMSLCRSVSYLKREGIN